MDAYGSLNPVLEITVQGCSKLKNMNYFTKQHPYVWLDYVGTEFRTTTHREGGNNPTYNQKYYFRLIEDVDQLDVRVYSRNTVASDTFIGSGRVYLQRVLFMGYDETAWPIVDKHNKFAGEVKLIMVILQDKGQSVPSAPPLVNNNEDFLEDVDLGMLSNVIGNNTGESFEDVGLGILSNVIGSNAIENIIEKIGLFIFTKTLEYLGLKSRSR